MSYRQIKYLIIFNLIFFVFHGEGAGQVSYGGKPFPYDSRKSDKKVYQLPLFDYKWVLEEMSSEKMLDGKKPLPVGWNYEVDLNPENSGYWEIINDSIKIWRLEIYSRNAYALSVFFNQFYLDEGISLFLYDPAQSEIKGSYDHRSNKLSGTFPVSYISGERIIVELQMPLSLKNYGQLNIGRVTHYYADLFKTEDKKDGRFRTSESCNIDVNCPSGDDWQEVKRAVCRIIFTSGASSVLCSGALINNTSADGAPFLLTANHCIDNFSKAESAIFYFGYESPSCNGPDAPTDKTIAGSELKATSEDLDFSLLLLSEDIPENYEPYFAGWTISTTPSPTSVCIHHPNGDVKKISTNNNPLTSQYQPVPPKWLVDSTPNGFWRVIEWSQGATQGGSSGSPLFNNYGLIVGNLTGGDASCANPKNDYFSKFYMCWNYFVAEDMQLKPWLDKDETGKTSVPGYDPYFVPDTASTLLDLLLSSPAHQTLCAAIVSSGLSQIFDGKDFYTVFAPTDAAFQKLLPGTLELIQNYSESKLSNLVKNHIVPGSFLSSSFYSGLRLNTLADNYISISINNNNIFYDFAPLSEVDIMAGNGVLHVIDEVVLPIKEQDPFIIFPNPAIRDFWIISRYESMRGASLKVYDLQGSLVADYLIQDDKLERFNLFDLPSGIYLIQIFHEQRLFRKKLMIARPEK